MQAMDVIQENPERYRTYKNGAIFDKEKGRIVALRPELAEKNTQITPATSSELLAKRLERKRLALQAGANRVIQQRTGKLPEDGEFVEYIGEALMESATDPTNRQQVRAAEMLIRETGLSERQDTAPQVTGGQAADIIASLAQFAATIAAVTATQPPEQTVDGDIVPPELPNHSI